MILGLPPRLTDCSCRVRSCRRRRTAPTARRVAAIRAAAAVAIREAAEAVEAAADTVAAGVVAATDRRSVYVGLGIGQRFTRLLLFTRRQLTL